MQFTFRVDVEADTLEHAKDVMDERICHNEDYGYDYQLSDPLFLGMSMSVDRPPQGVIQFRNNDQQWTRENPDEINEMLLAEPMHFQVHVVRGGNYEPMTIHKDEVKTVRNYS
jgi:hypothetical protein